MARYRLTRSARENLVEIAAYIAADNVDSAIALTERFEHTFGLLADNPNAGRLRPDIAREIRSFPVGSYVLLYRASAGEVLIVRIIHAARDIEEQVREL